MTVTHPEKRLIGYPRVSTYGQTLDSQLEQLRKAGCNSRNIHREKVTGAHSDRRELLRMLDRLAPPLRGGYYLGIKSRSILSASRRRSGPAV
jgi:DNA invertase Pin-like site-specific DNA recombinase